VFTIIKTLVFSDEFIIQLNTLFDSALLLKKKLGQSYIFHKLNLFFTSAPSLFTFLFFFSFSEKQLLL